MHALVLALVLAPLAPQHARSEGRARFDLDDTGRLDMEITLSELDMPELCNIDLSNRALRAERLRELDVCLTRDIPRLVRVQVDEGSCPLLVHRVAAEKNTVTAVAVASCPSFPSRLIVHWGLFAATPLDHVAVASFSQPHAAPKLVMLSKRSAKLVVDIARPLWPRLVVLAIVALLCASAGWFVLRRGRTRER